MVTVPLDLSKIQYTGKTREERKLGKALLETVLELNSYQDAYDFMKTTDEIVERIESIKNEITDEYIPNEEIIRLQTELKTLEWVLGAKPIERAEHATREDVERIVKNYHTKYKQMSMEDFGVQEEN